MDLVWVLAKARLQGDAPMPSELWNKKADKRSAKQIIQDTLDGLGGE